MILWDINRLATRDIKARLKLSTDNPCCRTEVHLWLQLSLQAVEGHAKDGCRRRDSRQAGSHPTKCPGAGQWSLSHSVWKHRVKEGRRLHGESS